jgi:WD40 repeat protein
VEVTQNVAASGNRSDVRALALSDDDSMLLSTGNGGSKLWSSMNGKCLNSIETGYGLSVLFAPGGKYAVVGCKDGHCDIVDIGMAAVVGHIAAHTSQVCISRYGRSRRCARGLGCCCTMLFVVSFLTMRTVTMLFQKLMRTSNACEQTA